MKYKIRQKLFSVGNKYFIGDSSDTPVYQIIGKVFSWGDSLSFQKSDGTEIARIEQKLLSWKPRYRIYRQGEMFAEVIQEWTWLKQKFTLDVPGPNDYTIAGSFWQHEYVFQRGGREVAQVSKKIWSMADIYGVDIIDGEDDESILATCVVIDLICAAKNSSAGAS